MVYVLLTAKLYYPLQTAEQDVKKKKKSLNLFILLIILKTSKTRDSGCAPSMGEGRMVSEGGYEVMGQL